MSFTKKIKNEEKDIAHILIEAFMYIKTFKANFMAFDLKNTVNFMTLTYYELLEIFIVEIT